MSESKLCIHCEHFDLTAAYDVPGYSEVTPGYTVEAQIPCRLGYWSIDNETENVNQYRKCIEQGLTCPDFQRFKEVNTL